MSKDTIVFDNPDELGSLLQEDQAPDIKQKPQSEIVAEIQKNAHVKPVENGPRDRSKDRSWAIPGQLPKDREKTFCIDGLMVSESAARPILAETVDPESFNFLISKQKQKLEPAELSVVGKDRRYPDTEELDSVVGQKCPFCNEPITQEEANWKEIGSLCFYGQDLEGQPKVFHWACLSLWALLAARGHPLKAAETFNLDPDEMTNMKMFYRSIPWGRFGFLREEGH